MKSAALLLGLLALPLVAPSAPAGELAIVGTGDGINVLAAVGDAFKAKNPSTTVLVPPSIHSSGGVRSVVFGTAVLGRVARPLSPEERAHGISEVPVFRLPAAFFVNPGVGVTDLSTEQLTKIYAGEVTNWREVGGPDLRIRVVRREEVDSTLRVFRETLPGWKDISILERSKLATTTQEAFLSVQQVEGAIGFGPYSLDLDSRVTVLRVDGRLPTDRAYPSAVTLILIYRPANLTDEARQFLDFMATAEAHEVVRRQGAMPLDNPLRSGSTSATPAVGRDG